MKKILLACAGGFSTSILVKRMDDYCLDNDIDAEILAVPMGEAGVIGNQGWDVVMIAPQTAFKQPTMQEIINVPVVVIPSSYYATGKAKETIELAFKSMKEGK